MSEAEYFAPFFASMSPLFPEGSTRVIHAGGCVHGVVSPSFDQMRSGRRQSALTVSDMTSDPTSEIALAVEDIRRMDARWL